MKLGIIGSRRRNKSKDYELLINKVLALKPTMIISGGCWKGADAFAEQIAEDHGIPITIYYPALKRYTKYTPHEITKANYARNEFIALESEYLIALVAPDRRGGTEHTIRCFEKWNKGKLEIL